MNGDHPARRQTEIAGMVLETHYSHQPSATTRLTVLTSCARWRLTEALRARVYGKFPDPLLCREGTEPGPSSRPGLNGARRCRPVLSSPACRDRSRATLLEQGPREVARIAPSVGR